MARFILDIANIEHYTDAQIKKINEAVCDLLLDRDLASGMITIHCIDKTNDNQFYSEYENGETNELSEKQIASFKSMCNI